MIKINISFSKSFIKSKANRRYLHKNNYGIFWFSTEEKFCFIELFTKQFNSTVKTLIHEINHQVLYELIDCDTCLQYDNIAPKLDKYLYY